MYKGTQKITISKELDTKLTTIQQDLLIDGIEETLDSLLESTLNIYVIENTYSDISEDYFELVYEVECYSDSEEIYPFNLSSETLAKELKKQFTWFNYDDIDLKITDLLIERD